MVGSFQELEILFGLFEMGKAQVLGFYNESLPVWLLGSCIPQP